MKLYLHDFAFSLDLSSELVTGIYIDGKTVYFIHSDSTITVFVNGEMDCYRFGVPLSSEFVSFSDYFKNFEERGFLNVLSKKNEKKLVSKKFSKRSWCKKS